MKRLGGVWSQVVSFENLLLAYRKARRGKGQRPEVAASWAFCGDWPAKRTNRLNIGGKSHSTHPHVVELAQRPKDIDVPSFM